MKSISRYVDDLKDIFGSYNKVAEYLEIQPARLFNIRKGEAIPDDLLLKMAEKLDIDVIELIAAKNAERTKSPEMKKKWEHVAKSVAATFVIVIAGFFVNVEEANAEIRIENNQSIIYLMRS